MLNTTYVFSLNGCQTKLKGHKTCQRTKGFRSKKVLGQKVVFSCTYRLPALATPSSHRRLIVTLPTLSLLTISPTHYHPP